MNNYRELAEDVLEIKYNSDELNNIYKFLNCDTDTKEEQENKIYKEICRIYFDNLNKKIVAIESLNIKY